MNKIPYIILCFLQLTYCACDASTVKPQPSPSSYFYFQNLQGGHFVYKGLKVEILNELDSLLIEYEELVVLDIITPLKKEYNFALLPHENIYFKFSSENNEIEFYVDEEESKNKKILEYYKKIYESGGLNDKIKEKYSDSLSNLTKAGKTEELYNLLNRILNTRFGYLEQTLSDTALNYLKNYIKNDAALSMHNSYLRRGFKDKFTINLIDSLLNSYNPLEAKVFFENPHYFLLFNRLITNSYKQSTTHSIKSHAYDCFKKYLHPSVKYIKMKGLAEDALDQGDSSYAIKFLVDCDDTYLKGGVMEKLISLRSNNTLSSYFEDELQNKLSIMEILQKFSSDFIVVDIWASWCSPCIEELQHYDVYKQKLAAKGAELLIISIDDKGDSWVKAHKRLNLPNDRSYRIISNKKVFFEKEIKAIPYKFILTKDGKVIHLGNQTVEAFLVSAKAKKGQ